MMELQRIKTAKNSDALKEIVACAMYSYAGRIIYRKWDNKTKKFVRRSHVIVPIDCGVTSLGNRVLYAEDVEEHMQVKMFKISQIVSFENLHEKHHTAFPVQLDRIRKMLGETRGNHEERKEVAGMNKRNLSVKIKRIAQRIFEFSGCDGNLYSERKRKDPYSYESIGDDGRTGRIAMSIVSALTEKQKSLTDEFAKKRKDGLSFGDYFKWDSSGRAFMPLDVSGKVQDITKINDDSAKEIASILDKEGYVCPDYASGYCYKKTDKEFSAKNAPKVLTILKKSLRGDKPAFERLSKAYNERESGTMKRKGNVRLFMCVTHNPEDISGMSTDRDWTSCMRLPFDAASITKKELANATKGENDNFNIYIDYNGLFGREKISEQEIEKKYGIPAWAVESTIKAVNDMIQMGGEYYSTALKQVKYGGMVAYLVREDDRNIDKPLARIAIKRFENREGGFVFKAENVIYGDQYISAECNFASELRKELEQSNAMTKKGSSKYVRNDSNSWTDSGKFSYNEDITPKSLEGKTWDEVYRIIDAEEVKLNETDLDNIIKSHKFPPPKGLFDLFEKKSGELSDDFIQNHAGILDVDKYRSERGEELVPKSEYNGNDAPRSIDEMNSFLVDAMENARLDGDYGEVDDDMPIYSGNVSPDNIVYSEDVPDIIRNYSISQVKSELKDYYQRNRETFEKYDNYASFEDDYEEGNLPVEMYDDINSAINENLSDNSMIDYQIELNPIVVEGYEYDSVYKINGAFIYILPVSFSGVSTVVAYENSTVVDTRENGWKEKIRDFVEDLYDIMPQFF